MHINSHTKFQLSNSITSWDMESSICHWFNIGPRNGFLGFSPLDLGFFWCRMGFWVFLAKSDKIWVSEALQFFAAFYYQFTDDTKFHGTETAVVMIFNFFAIISFISHNFRMFIVALRSSWYVTTNKLVRETLSNTYQTSCKKRQRLLHTEAIEPHGWRSERRTLLEEIRDHNTVYNTVPSDVIMTRWLHKSNRCQMLYTEL